jgi:hypothetical protein
MNFGIKGGVNFSSQVGDIKNTSLKSGLQIGVMTDFKIMENISFQPGIVLSSKGVVSEYSTEYQGANVDTKTTIKLNYLEIPMNFSYGINLEKGKFSIIAGAYTALGIGGRYLNEYDGIRINSSEELHIEYVTDQTKVQEGYPITPLDVGLNYGLGYKVGFINFQIIHGLGLTNILPPVDGDEAPNRVTNSSFQLSMTFWF